MSAALIELAWLRDCRHDAERQAERLGPLRGPIRPAQRPWSYALDTIEAQRQHLAEALWRRWRQ